MKNPPQEPSNPELDYLQAKETGYGNGSLFSNIGVSQHQQAGLRARRAGKTTFGDVLGFVFVMGAAGFTFVEISERTNDVLYAFLGAIAALYIATKFYALPAVKRLFNFLAWSGILLGALYFFSAT